ncbi:hypothetical protein SLE2022_266290 [Rubroshorea leprosula]
MDECRDLYSNSVGFYLLPLELIQNILLTLALPENHSPEIGQQIPRLSHIGPQLHSSLQPLIQVRRMAFPLQETVALLHHALRLLRSIRSLVQHLG